MVRLATAIAWNGTLESYAHPGPLYIAVTGALWAVIGVFLLWSFWRRAAWTRFALLLAAGSYAAWTWLDRLFVQPQIRANWPFALVMTVLLLGLAAGIILDPRNKTYFVERGL